MVKGELVPTEKEIKIQNVFMTNEMFNYPARNVLDGNPDTFAHVGHGNGFNY